MAQTSHPPLTLRQKLTQLWEKIATNRRLLPILLVVGLALSFLIPEFNLVNPYVQLIMMYVGINIILTLSLNLINGYMGEFSVGHAGFMAVGAYISAVLTTQIFARDLNPWLFPLAVLAGGIGAALIGRASCRERVSNCV